MRCIEDNKRRGGPHLKTVYTSNVYGCRNLCEKTEECKAFDYDKKSKKCYLRGAIRSGKYNKDYYTSCPDLKKPTSKPWKTVWRDKWEKRRTLDQVETDWGDKKCSMRGSGKLIIGNGTMKMYGEPRYYIKHYNKDNVEFEAYFKLNKWKNNRPKYNSGFTLVTLSNHDKYKINPCEARGYYMRLWADGRFGFQQEFRHSSSSVNYGNYPSVKVMNKIPKGKWIGLKMKIRRVGNKTMLYGYLDTGNGWKLRLSENATNVRGWDPCKGSKPIRNGSVSFIRTDAADYVEVKNARLKNYFPNTLANIDINNPDIVDSDYKIYILLVCFIALLIFFYYKNK